MTQLVGGGDKCQPWLFWPSLGQIQWSLLRILAAWVDFRPTLLWHGQNIYLNPPLTVTSNTIITSRKSNPGSHKCANEDLCAMWATANVETLLLFIGDWYQRPIEQLQFGCLLFIYPSLHSLPAVWGCFFLFSYPRVLFQRPWSFCTPHRWMIYTQQMSRKYHRGSSRGLGPWRLFRLHWWEGRATACIPPPTPLPPPQPGAKARNYSFSLLLELSTNAHFPLW